MCPLKREQATRVSYNTLTHSRDSIVKIGRKSRSIIKDIKFYVNLTYFLLYSSLFVILIFHSVSCLWSHSYRNEAYMGAIVIVHCTCSMQIADSRTTTVFIIWTYRLEITGRKAWHPIFLRLSTSLVCSQQSHCYAALLLLWLATLDIHHIYCNIVMPVLIRPKALHFVHPFVLLLLIIRERKVIESSDLVKMSPETAVMNSEIFTSKGQRSRSKSVVTF